MGNPDPDHLAYGLGNWLYRTDGQGNGTVLTSPGSYGTHGWIDTERNYRGLLIMDEDYGPAKRLFDELLPVVEAQVQPATCP